jgi:Ca2+-binding EF-hand superfamily protein
MAIPLNQRDLNNIFCIFDSDKSGSIQLQEMRETLDNYAKMQMDLEGAPEEDEQAPE